MFAINARFDGKNIILPDEVRKIGPGDVIVVFGNGTLDADERAAWLEAQQQSLAKVWDNDDDAVYDTL